ncbi:hypothetical protein EYF80_035759 [Liparis tanakae]|uniref:Uncharacterized protein n=1 Tax=Liparis tanakae TaxID=230148 RepID=A0A4Z2GKN2_9TELE|nr:hypothetical protein EYF80_035759 [Liparis tanakae]
MVAPLWKAKACSEKEADGEAAQKGSEMLSSILPVPQTACCSLPGQPRLDFPAIPQLLLLS